MKPFIVLHVHEQIPRMSGMSQQPLKICHSRLLKITHGVQKHQSRASILMSGGKKPAYASLSPPPENTTINPFAVTRDTARGVEERDESVAKTALGYGVLCYCSCRSSPVILPAAQLLAQKDVSTSPLKSCS